MITAEEVLRNRLVRVMEHPEVRSGQLAMAETIAAALEKQQCVAVEAGTGTGKSLGALVPAALYAARREKRVVVAPHTIALQEQLIRKNVPLLKKLLEPEVKLKARVIKGRGNYVCNWKVHESHRFARGLSFASPAAAAQFTKLIEHLKRTDAGERENVPFGLFGEVWEPVKSEGDSCTGQRCRYFRECHYLKAVREAAKADLIIANQALVFTDLAMRAGGQDGVLPEYDVLILDEAHHLEESATRAWKVQLDGRTFERAARALRELAGALGAKKRGADRFQACAEAVIQEGASWLRSLPLGAVHAPCGDPTGLADLVSSAERDLAWLEGAALKDEQQMAMETCAVRLGDLLRNVRAWSGQSLGEWAYWVTQDRQANVTAEMAIVDPRNRTPKR